MKKKSSLTIKQEMFLLGFSSFILGSFVFVGVFFFFFFNSNLSNAKNTLHACNNQIVTYVEGVFHESANLVDILSRDKTIINAGYGKKEDVIHIFEEIHQKNSNITYIYSGYSDGTLYINNYNTPQGFDATTRPWYLESQREEGVARLVYGDAATGVWLFSHSKKLVNESGNMVGTVCIDSSNENITRKLSTKYQYDSQRSFITDLNGKVLIHSDSKEIDHSLLSGRISEEAWKNIVNGKNNYAEYMQHGYKSMAYFERIPDTDFFVVTAINSEEVINPIMKTIFIIVLLIVAISILLGFILSQTLNYRFVRPIMELSNRIQRVAEKKEDKQHSIKYSNAEINNIADSIEIIVRDIATGEEKRKTAEYLSLHDPMTSLYNRRYFEEELQRLDVPENYPLCIISCDINGLKLVNDVFGHIVGDHLITQIAKGLQKTCRINDFAARTGGDEFVVVLPNTTASIAEQFILRIKTGFIQQEFCGVVVSASFGFAIKTETAQELEKVIFSADEMMYTHKRSESLKMKNSTIHNIIDAAIDEGLIRTLNEQENECLELFAEKRCPNMLQVLKDVYRLRKIGLCSLLMSDGSSNNHAKHRHTESGYRILSALDDYKDIAEYVLHYSEHWDGHGWPAGLSDNEIPLLSRIIAVTEAYCQEGGADVILKHRGTFFDPELVDLLLNFKLK